MFQLKRKKINVGFEMSECFKLSKDPPVIVQQEENDCESVHEQRNVATDDSISRQ